MKQKKQKTKVTRKEEIKRQWHLVDLEGKILGREAVEIATLLMGKNKSYFTRQYDCGDYVVAINAAKIRVSGQKGAQKVYRHYSGYPGGLDEKAFGQAKQKDPGKIIRQAVWGMLPKNKLRDQMIKRLYGLADEKNPYEEQFSAKANR